MSKEQAMMHMLESAAKMQWNIAMILEAKTVEAEKARNWIINHVGMQSFERHEEQLKRPLAIHEQLVEMLEGLTRVQTGLCNHMKALLDVDGGAGGGMGGMFGDTMGGGEDFDT